MLPVIIVQELTMAELSVKEQVAFLKAVNNTSIEEITLVAC